MRKWTRTAGVLFLAASSVYYGPAGVAVSAIGAAPAGNAAAADVSVTPLRAAAPAVTPAYLPGLASTNAAAPSNASGPSNASAPAPAKAEETTDPFGGPATRPGADAGAPEDRPADAVVHSKPGAGPKLTASDAGTFSIQINKDVTLVEVLRMIGSQAQVSIIPSKDVSGTVPAMDLYNVTVHEALDALLHTNGFAYREKGNFIYVYSAKELAALDKQARVASTEVFRLYYTPAANAVNMIKPVLSVDAQVSFTTPAVSGIETGTKDAGGDSHATNDTVVVTDYPENLEKVRRVFKEIDRRPQQILVEATILRASLTENNALGIDFTILGSVNFADLAGVGHAPNDALTGNILNDPASKSLLQNGYNGASTGFTQNVPTGGLQVGIVQNNIAVFLRALEQVTDTTVLANPKVLALDKQRGEVIVGRKDGYLTTTVTSNAQTQTVEFLETGTRLVFRPFVGDDGYIRMEVHPEDSSGGLTGANLPFKITTEVTSNIMVKDGHTVLIGGLFRESSTSSKAQVPFLGNLPLAGPLFRQQTDATTREEIIILLTPHIVKDDAAFSEASEREIKDMDKLRVGVRQGMMPWGRERLAETCYEAAEAEMHKPHPDLNTARWHLDCATNLNPKFREAIELKQKVTGQVLTTSDNSSVRGFVRRMILADRPRAATRPAGDDNVRDESNNPPPAVPIWTAPVKREAEDLPVDLPATQPAQPVDVSPVDVSPATRPASDRQTVTNVQVDLKDLSFDVKDVPAGLNDALRDVK